MWIFWECGIERRALTQVEGRSTRRLHPPRVLAVSAQPHKAPLPLSLREVVHSDTIADPDLVVFDEAKRATWRSRTSPVPFDRVPTQAASLFTPHRREHVVPAGAVIAGDCAVIMPARRAPSYSVWYFAADMSWRAVQSGDGAFANTAATHSFPACL